jgi:two-component system, chemotaxis family, response regulator Rcp1
VAGPRPIRVPYVRTAPTGVLGRATPGHAASARVACARSLVTGNRIEYPVLLKASADGRLPPAGSQDPAAFAVARILVIEDNESDVYLLERALHQQNLRFELLHLLNGNDVLAFIRRQGAFADAPIPDLILMDLKLSKYGGEDLLPEIRRAGYFGHVPVCVWSSSQSRPDDAALTDLGVSRFIIKPSGLDRFMDIGKTLMELLTLPRPT